jgi:ubiquinone/menaquinone biosynthesis C-methylase UbiE
MSDEATIRAMYDRLAAEYARHLSDELEHKPLDRGLLARVVAHAPGVICDLGCGPGHVARYLASLGGHVVGIDLSPAMIDQARALAPNLEFRVGSMLALDVADGAFAGVVAAYSIVNLDDADIAQACREIARVLEPFGVALVSFHIGAETVRPPELFGVPIEMDFHLLEPARVCAHLEAAGLVVLDTIERDPYPDVEYPSRRAYVFAQR